MKSTLIQYSHMLTCTLRELLVAVISLPHHAGLEVIPSFA